MWNTWSQGKEVLKRNARTQTTEEKNSVSSNDSSWGFAGRIAHTAAESKSRSRFI